MNKIMKSRLCIAISLAALLQGCAVGDFPPAPPEQAPQQWRNADAGVTSNLQRQWWQLYDDPVLDDLVQKVIERNPYSRFGELHVAEAAAGVDASESGLYPHLGFGAGVDESHTSTNTPLGQLLGGRSIAGKTWQAGLNAGWQLDLWGRIRQAVEVAKAHKGIAEATRRSVEVILASEVAVAYWQYRSAEEELKLLQQLKAVHEESLRLTSLRLESGLNTELDLVKVRADLARTLADIEKLKVASQMAEQELAILLLEPITDYRVPPIADYRLPAIPQISPGVPAKILARRPDLIDSALRLRALLAQERIAQTAFYPDITLTAAYGFASEELSDLSAHSSRTFGLGPLQLYLPIFDAGRNRANLKVARARYEQQVNVHKVNVLIALREVDDALAEVRGAREQVRLLGEGVADTRRGIELAEARYERGENNYLNVTGSQAESLKLQRELLHSHSEGLLASVRLVDALGGGWDHVPEEAQDTATP